MTEELSNLELRDKFLVERGLWSDFCDWLPTPPSVSDHSEQALELVEELARVLAVADGINICSDASYRHSSYGIRARAILPIITRREQQAAEAGLAEKLEAWLHTTGDQDVAYAGLYVLSAIREQEVSK